MQVLWEGQRSSDMIACPYDVDFEAKPGLANSLNSLESGRLLVTVRLDSAENVSEVWTKLVNNARGERIDPSRQQGSELKKVVAVQTMLSEQRGKNSWTGEISIPSSWTEGATSTFERTGSFTQTERAKVFSLDISYLLRSGVRCTARFSSEDAYHWSK